MQAMFEYLSTHFQVTLGFKKEKISMVKCLKTGVVYLSLSPRPVVVWR